MVKVSIIIPIYNTEKYLRKCLESVMNQTLQDIEIICIDDGSTDNSYQILMEYQKRDNRIIVVHTENQGSVKARNLGIDMAKGKYIAFVDSDDWIEKDMYERLYKVACLWNVQLVTSGYYREGNYTTIQFDGVDEGLYSAEDMRILRENMIYCVEKRQLGLSGSLCCKIFQRDILEKVKGNISEKLSFSEDKMMILSYVLNCDSVYVLHEAYYHYIINPNSLVNTPNSRYLLAVNEVYQCLQKFYQHPNFSSEMRKQAEIYITELLIMGINSRLGFQNRNLLWIDPYWLDKLPQNSRIILYGAGELGRKYKKHLNSRKDCTYIACVDPNHEKNTTEEFPILPVKDLQKLDYDYVVITIKNPTKATEVKENLKDFVPEEKILWFEQPEIFWKYAQADGLL